MCDQKKYFSIRYPFYGMTKNYSDNLIYGNMDNISHNLGFKLPVQVYFTSRYL